MRIAILDDYQDVALASADWTAVQARAEVVTFRDHLADEDALADRLPEFDAVVAMRERTPFPRTLLERLPNLKLLVTTGMANASIDLKATEERGIVVSGTRGLDYPTAELAWGLIIGLIRRIPSEFQSIRNGGWQVGLGEGLHGKTLGVLGLGRLGSRVATVGLAFGMDVVAWSQNLTRERADEVGVRLAASKEELLRESDVVTIHLILSARTRGLLAADDLRLMKPGAYLVNTSRAPIVDQDALAEVLRAGRIAGAALDVFEQEPLPAGHSYLGLDNVVLTPHVGYVTRETYEVFYGDAVADILAFLDGSPVRLVGIPGR